MEKSFSKNSLKRDMFPTLFLNAKIKNKNHGKAKRQNAYKGIG
jgi:hypothetical protein